MISVEAALKTVLKNIKTLGPQTVTLTDSLRRVLAENIYSNADIPSFGNSAMDGYAVKASDTIGASKRKGKRLRVIEDVKAGSIAKKILKNGQGIRIMTGAPIPNGADSVIMVEETKRDGDSVEILKEVNPQENIRSAGEDIRKGELVIEKGTLLTSAHIGVLASLGIPAVKATRRPVVAVLATGDELVGVHQKLRPGKLHSSNTYSLYSQILNCGGLPKNLGIAKDKTDELKAKIKKGLLSCDLLLTSGGVSVGDYDLVKSVLKDMGTDIKFWQVAMRPGKPLAFGKIKAIPVFGLPGNPVSSMVSFEVFVRPAILKMLGQGGDCCNEIDAVLKEAIFKKNGLKYFLRAVTRWEEGHYVTRTTGPQGSGILKSMTLANSLIILPEDIERVEKGEKVKVRFLK